MAEHGTPARQSQVPAGTARLLRQDLSASLLVFLVALPLCLGIAIASGAPPARGLVTGILGGILTGALSGAPLAVSGPAAGLTVLVFEIVARHGLAALGPVVLLAGLLQILAGIARLGRLVRHIPHAVVDGMMAAIGLILAASQARVLLGGMPAAGFTANLRALPGAIAGVNPSAAALGLLAIAVLLAWERFRPRLARDVPASVIAVALTTLLALAAHLAVPHVAVPTSLAGAVAFPGATGLAALATPSLIGAAFSLALIASIESLLSAAAVDRMTPGRAGADYGRELVAQGVGNMACGLLGALPMTGVIVRSAANVRAGARTRASAMLHGVWLLALVGLAPGLLATIPTPSLAGLLVVVGLRLASPAALRRAARAGWQDAALLATTLCGVLAANLLLGVAAGLALAGAFRLSRRLATRPA